jgi:hypothetical protein
MESVISNGLNDIHDKNRSVDSVKMSDRLSVLKKEHVEAKGRFLCWECLQNFRGSSCFPGVYFKLYLLQMQDTSSATYTTKRKLRHFFPQK